MGVIVHSIFKKSVAGKSLAVIVCLCTLILPAFGTGAAEDVEQLRRQEQQKIEQQIRKSRIKIQRLQSGLERQQEGYERARLKEQGVLAELERLDTRLFKKANRLETLRQQMRRQRNLIEEKEEELRKTRQKSDTVRAHMQTRIEAYYKLGKVDLIDITFSTQTLSELLRFHDSFQTLIAYDKKLMERYRRAIDNLESAKRALTLERGLLEEFIEQANEQEQSILQVRQEKAALLDQIKNQGALHKQAIKELKDAKSELAVTLLSLKKKEKLIDQGFLMNKGNHPPPVNGVVTSLYNQERVNQFGFKKKSPGILIRAEDGTKIRSIYQGRVVYSGYLKGYGNTVIIDHGYKYYTITSRIERILAKKGQTVKRNSLLGIMGSTATILDEGLYFEIRHRDTPLDPIVWLDKEKLQFEEELQRSFENE